MTQYDYYNPITQKGNLPVRVLPYNFLDWFANITPEFKEETKAEVDYNGLNAGIKYHVDMSIVKLPAWINPDKQIELYENYNQYLWCICYSLLVIFDEGIQKPTLTGKFNGSLDHTNRYVRNAIEVFNNGFDLLSSYKSWQFYQLPNPEKYDDIDKYYIEKANGIFTAAMTFILLHEFGHQYFGHLEYTPTEAESKKEEFIADNFAIEKISHNFPSERGRTFKCGIIAGICSLIMLDKSLRGGDTHPDSDERLTNAMEKLSLTELDNLWGIASLGFRLWALKYGIEFTYPAIVDCYKELFEMSLKQARESKYF